MSLGSHFVSIADFRAVSSTRHQRNANALHSWVPGYTFSQRGYTGVITPLRMHVQKRPIQRNARCMLPYARDFILVTYLPDICSVFCWSHVFLKVQCSTNCQVFTLSNLTALCFTDLPFIEAVFSFIFFLVLPCLYCKY